jgi:hypothetical protein
MQRLAYKRSPVWIPLWIALVVLVGSIVMVGIGAALFGVEEVWDLLAGISSPSAVSGKNAPAIAWSISILGYVLVPTFIGLLVGGLAEILVQSRLAPIVDRLAEVRQKLEGSPQSPPQSNSSGGAVP